MGSKFLGGGNADLSTLTDGTFNLNISSAVVQSLAPSLPLRTTASKQLTTGLIQVSDCAFTFLTNPATSNLGLGGYAITNIKEALINANVMPSTPAATGLNIYTSGSKLRYKDDTTAIYQVATSTDLATYLPLAGGTMSGPINMSAFNITNIGTISGPTNTSTVDNLITNAGTATLGRVATFSSNKIIQDGGTLLSDLATNASLATYLLKSGGTMTGAINMGTREINNISAIRPVDSNVNIGSSTSQAAGGLGNTTLNDFATTTGNYGFAAGLQATAKNNAIAIGRGSIAQDNATVIGYQSTVSAARTDSVVIGHDNTSSGTSADILGVNRTNNITNSLLLGNGSYVNIRANTTCDLGTSTAPFQSVYLNGSIAGATNSRSADNIVSNAGTGLLGRVVTFSSDKVIQDGGVLLSSLATTASLASYLLKSGGTMTGALAMGANNITNIGTISGPTNTSTVDNLITNAGTATLGRVATFSANKVIQDGGTLLSDLATNAGLNLRLLKAGDTMSGALAMATNNITNVGLLSGATNSRAADNIVSNAGTGLLGRVVTFSSDKVIQDGGTLLSDLATTTATNAGLNLRLLKSGDTMTGALAMGANAITSTGTLSAGATTLSGALAMGTNAITSTGTLSAGATTLSGALAMGTNAITSTGTLSAGATTLSGTLAMGSGAITGTGTISIGAVVTGTLSAGATTLSGALAMGANAITSTGTLSAGATTLSGALAMGTNAITSTGTLSAGATTLSGALAMGTNAITGTGIRTAGATTLSGTLTMGANAITSTGTLNAGATTLSGKISILSGAASQGLDTATGDVYANMRVIQNTSGVDKDIYLGFQSSAGSSLHLYSNSAQTVFVNNGNTVVGGAVSVAAVDGFLYIPTVNGTKTGTPTSYAGTVPLVFDTSTNRLVVYVAGTWKSVGPFA